MAPGSKYFMGKQRNSLEGIGSDKNLQTVYGGDFSLTNKPREAKRKLGTLKPCSRVSRSAEILPELPSQNHSFPLNYSVSTIQQAVKSF